MTQLSTLKTRADVGEAQRFLERRLDIPVKAITAIDGGEVALAFDVTTDSSQMIFRLGPNQKNFIKDGKAHELYNSDMIPIPALHQTGTFNDRLFYALSEKAPGIRMDRLDEAAAARLRPSILATLEAIHLSRLPEENGFGRWAAAQPLTASWKERLLNGNPKSDLPNGGSFEDQSSIHRYWERCRSLCELMPEIRCLVHGDFGGNNAFVQNDRISGVIDWAESLYGDPLYDVAWLTFWKKDKALLGEYLETAAGKKFGQENPEERLECYSIRIGLGALTHFERSAQTGSFDWTLQHMRDTLPERF